MTTEDAYKLPAHRNLQNLVQQPLNIHSHSVDQDTYWISQSSICEHNLLGFDNV
jgi:hypothetical protein